MGGCSSKPLTNEHDHKEPPPISKPEEEEEEEERDEDDGEEEKGVEGKAEENFSDKNKMKQNRSRSLKSLFIQVCNLSLTLNFGPILALEDVNISFFRTLKNKHTRTKPLQFKPTVNPNP